MSAFISGQSVNLLLDGLPDKELRGILDHCEQVDLMFGAVLRQPDQPIAYVYFPISGVISLITVLLGHPPLGLAMIGNEGMLDAVLVLSDHLLPTRGAVVQNAGKAWRMKTSKLRQQLRKSPILLFRLNHYLYLQIAQISRSSGCTHFHEIEPRLARWLLMTHDRIHSDCFHLTHELLADMLGVRRSGVTVAAGAVQFRKLISYNRGDIKILDRKGLEATACECYCVVKNENSVLLS